ncbi:MAG: hypothetical protein JWM78_3389 [Verrucomicrobiaceae bacterium]|nr:hypothetical protein [Verrucomicrobiaceae bacterium]
MTNAQTAATAASTSESPERRNITAWIEKNIGGKVTHIELLRRWRPIWHVSLEKDGKARQVLVKGIRPWDSIPYSLEHEMVSMQVLEKNDILVPHVYGMIPDPEAFVMDWVDADIRDAGLVQQGIEHTSTMSPERWAASLKYMESLARIHKIPTEQFVGKELSQPVGAAQVALTHFERYLKMLEDTDGIDATMEFFAVWLRRNVPQHRTRPSYITGDCGQFLNKGEELVAIIDVEIGHLGDPMHDLACFRGRHPVENMGDLPALYRHYEKASGEPLDLPTLAYHTVVFQAMATIAPILAIRERHPGGDWVEGAVQIPFIGRRAFEAMAECLGVELDDSIKLPAAHVAPLEELAVDKLLAEINRLPLSEDFPVWQRGVLASLPQFLLTQVRYGGWLEEEELNAIGELLGKRPANLVEGDKVLKAFVQKAGPDQDVTLLKLFYRRLLRMCLAYAGPNPPANHLLLMKVEPIMNMQR